MNEIKKTDDEHLNEQSEACSDRVEDAASREELLHELALCLKNARQKKGMGIDEVALALKLRTVYIEALESGSWDDMPGEVYALAFLKQYAVFLGLDVSDSIKKLKTGNYKLTKPLTFPDPPIAPNRTWAIVAALAFIVLLIIFNLFDFNPDDRAVQPSDSSRQPSAIESTSEPPAEPLPATSLKGEIEPISSPEMDIEPSIQDAKAVSDAVMHHYKLTAVGADVWLQLMVVEKQDAPPVLLKEALLRDGESLIVEHAAAELLLTCGNPVALQIHIDDVLAIAAGNLGEEGQVLRDFKLTPE